VCGTLPASSPKSSLGRSAYSSPSSTGWPGNGELVIWLNEFFGGIEAEGKTFEEMKVYQNNKDRGRGIVRITRQTGSTFGEDVKLMLDSKLTFDEIK